MRDRKGVEMDGMEREGSACRVSFRGRSVVSGAQLGKREEGEEGEGMGWGNVRELGWVRGDGRTRALSSLGKVGLEDTIDDASRDEGTDGPIGRC